MGILEDIIKYKMYKEYINLKHLEVIASFIMTMIAVWFCLVNDLYNNYVNWRCIFIHISWSLSIAMLGMLGLIFASISLVINILNKNIVSAMKKINHNDTINDFMTTFKFLVVNVVSCIYLNLMIYFINNLPIGTCEISKEQYYVIVCFMTYITTFIIFYLVGVINNVIRMYFISHNYSEINTYEKTLLEVANEQRIDFVILSLIKHNILSPNFVNELLAMIKHMDSPNEKKVEEYIRNYYKH